VAAALAGNAEDGQIVGLCTAAGEDDLAGVAAETGGQLAAGGFEALFGGLSEMVDTGRVAIHFVHGFGEGTPHLGRERRRGIMVKVMVLHSLLV